MAAQLDATEHIYDQNQESVGHTSSAEHQVSEDEADLELLQVDASFNQLLPNISLLYNQSISLVKKMQQVFGRSFLAAFTAEIQPSPLLVMQGGSSVGFFRTVGLEQILDSMYGFGRNVLEEFSSTVADVFEEIEEAEEYFQQGIRCQLQHYVLFVPLPYKITIVTSVIVCLSTKTQAPCLLWDTPRADFCADGSADKHQSAGSSKVCARRVKIIC